MSNPTAVCLATWACDWCGESTIVETTNRPTSRDEGFYGSSLLQGLFNDDGGPQWRQMPEGWRTVQLRPSTTPEVICTECFACIEAVAQDRRREKVTT